MSPKLDVVLLLPDGKFRSEVVANIEKLAALLERHDAAQVHACMEAAGIYCKSAAAFLAEKGHAVSVVNPAQISAFSSAALSRAKTDRTYAKRIWMAGDQTMLETINRLPCFVGNLFEANPHQHCASNRLTQCCLTKNADKFLQVKARKTSCVITRLRKKIYPQGVPSHGTL